MPAQQTQECKCCGASFPIDEERCPKCKMYVNEDPEEFQKWKDEQEDFVE